jgi:tRNA1Val (adenine37-N6)-methyltransferase
MPNTYFQFKQFTVNQERAALKVSTDSCLFGAWVSAEVKSKKLKVKNVLDIGAGTGLLMLMLAQNVDALIDGIEIDALSYEQAKENLNISEWSKRLHLFLGDVKEFTFETKYDLIVSNPPFYEGDLKSDAANRNVAMHDAGLKLDQLLKVVDKNLSDDGWFAVLLPYHRSEKFIEDAMKYNLFLQTQLNVKQTVKHSFFRSILLFGCEISEAQNFSMAIKDANNNYTVEFVELLKDYYLHL